jgi:hypothetical protein
MALACRQGYNQVTIPCGIPRVYAAKGRIAGIEKSYDAAIDVSFMVFIVSLD